MLIYAFYSLGNTVTISILPEDELPKVLVFLYGQTIYRILSTIVLISAFWLLYNVVGISMAALLSVSESKGRKIDANASSYIASGLKVLVAVSERISADKVGEWMFRDMADLASAVLPWRSPQRIPPQTFSAASQ